MKRIFYTDGACKGNPGPGGFGVIELVSTIRETYEDYIEYINVGFKYSEHCENTTNNREELKAIITVFELAAADEDNEYIIYSDSAYAVNIINNWIHNWARNNWVNSKGNTVENLDLIQILYKYISTNFFNCQVKKCKAHCNNIGNELADALATGNNDKFNKIVGKNNLYIIP